MVDDSNPRSQEPHTARQSIPGDASPWSKQTLSRECGTTSRDDIDTELYLDMSSSRALQKFYDTNVKYPRRGRHVVRQTETSVIGHALIEIGCFVFGSADRDRMTVD